MGKIKKNRSKRVDSMVHKRKTDLAGDIAADDQVNESVVQSEKVRFRQEEEDFVDCKLTKKILKQAVKQQKELEDVVGISDSPDYAISKPPKLESQTDSGSDDELDSDWPSLSESGQYDFNLPTSEGLEIDSEDEKALEAFMNPNPVAKRTLADIIMDKITEKKTEVSTLLPDGDNTMPDLDPRIIEVYKDVKGILVKYRSGKLPKAFKAIPHLKNWDEILFITEPETWSAAAMYEATRIFSSNLNVFMAQRFFNLVLLPRIRDDISYYKRLNFHLFMALKKALYKPASFFKGIILPLCEEGTCTLREATIIASVVTKCTIPVLHASAAMLKIAEMNYSGANSLFLRALIMKKYALPFRVIDALVFHFCQFRNEKRTLPVLWHQCLLAFVEIYRNDISDEQADSLREVIKYQTHEKMTPVIRQQLLSRESKEVMMVEPPM